MYGPVEDAFDRRSVGVVEPRLEFITMRRSERRDVEDHGAGVRAESRGGDLEGMFVVMF